MPVKLGLGEAGAGAAASAFGSGKGGPTSSSTNTNLSSNTSNGTNQLQYNEDPQFSSFRSSLLPALSSLYSQAQQPVYGAAQTAQVANAADQATQAQSGALNSRLAATGALNSGAAAAGQTALGQANTGSLTNFFSQVPFLNQQAELQNTGNVLNMATNFLGRDPINQTSTTNNTSTGSNTSIGSQYGPSTLNGLLNNLGGMGMYSGLNSIGSGKTAFNSAPIGADFGSPSQQISNMYGGGSPGVALPPL